MIPTFAESLEERLRTRLESLAERLKLVESRAQVIESGCLVTPYTGTIPATYTSGYPTVVLPTGVTLGPLHYANTYTPHAGDTVLLVPVGQSYIVVCAVV